MTSYYVLIYRNAWGKKSEGGTTRDGTGALSRGVPSSTETLEPFARFLRGSKISFQRAYGDDVEDAHTFEYGKRFPEGKNSRFSNTTITFCQRVMAWEGEVVGGCGRVRVQIVSPVTTSDSRLSHLRYILFLGVSRRRGLMSSLVWMLTIESQMLTFEC